MNNIQKDPPGDPDQAARHKAVLIFVTCILVSVPLVLGALRLLGYL